MVAPNNEETFWAKASKGPGCWEWQRTINRGGYGRLSYHGRMTLAHRLAHEFTYGPIPEGRMVDHICHNRRCVRPDHLRLATALQNAQYRKGALPVSSSGVRGVYWQEDAGKWRARIRHKGRNLSFGCYLTKKEAEIAVKAARARLFDFPDYEGGAS